jgi:putative hydrolase of the HAD superfamily
MALDRSTRDRRSGSELRAVTFDCWNTLIYEAAPAEGRRLRGAALRRAAAAAGRGLSADEAERLIQQAWQWHAHLVWQRGIVTGAEEMAAWTLEQLGLADASIASSLGRELAEAALQTEVQPLEGARATLAELAGRGVRLALVCDTGYSPGRVVRQLLDRAGLLEWLEVQIFSDEARVPKPDPSVFHAALEPLAVAPQQAVHVGDLRHTDVAGGRGVGMRTVRIRERNDDRSEHPEADWVVDSHAHLRRTLAVD